MQGVEHGLVVAALVGGNLRGTFATRAGQEDLAAAQHKGIGGAQPALQGMAFGVPQRAHKDGRSHTPEHTTFPFTWLGAAPGIAFWLAVLADVVCSVWSERRSTGEGGLQVHWIWNHFGVFAGLLLGGLSVVVIVLSNVVFPSTESDSEYTAVYLVGYAAILVVLAVIGFVASGTPSRIGTGARAGAIAALIATAIGLATFFVVDNLFLAIVSQQVDKIKGFHQSAFPTMRNYVNAGLVHTLILLPLLGAAGGVFGTMGAAARKLLRGYAPASR